MRIVITDADTVTTGDLSFSGLAQYGTVIRYGMTEPERLIERIKDADAVLCNKTKLTAEVMEKAPNLKYVGLFATGFNNIDIDYAKTHGITVCNAPGYSTDGVVQLTFSLMFELFGNLSKYTESVRQGAWKSSSVFSYFPYTIHEVSGKTLGIVGYGNIGMKVASVANALGMNVIVYTRTPKTDSSVKFVDFDTVLKESDVLSLHCPLNSASEKLINAEAIGKMKTGAYIINTSRGPVIDETALREALISGKIAGAGLDVLETEPMAKNCPLFGIENCIITPHIAWAGLETRARLMKLVEENLGAFIAGNPKNIVS